jgi:hypothetical protein
MKALTTQLNPYHGAINCLDDFGFRSFPTFSHVEKTIDSDKRGWDVYVFFKSGIVVNVHCKGYRVTINGKEFTAGNINREVALSAGEPTSWSNMRHQFPHLVSLYTPNH